jgi:hypothetical protein
LPPDEQKTPDSQKSGVWSLESGVRRVWSVDSGEHEPVPQIRHPISECASVIVMCREDRVTN